MQNISNIIENFIMSMIGEDSSLDLSRNYLAEHFNCAPSQINYVLATRFNINRGFLTESQRGGGGYIRLVKITDSGNDYIKTIINDRLASPISYKDAYYLVQELVSKKFLTVQESNIIGYAVSDAALRSPLKNEDSLRSQILKNILINKLR